MKRTSVIAWTISLSLTISSLAGCATTGADGDAGDIPKTASVISGKVIPEAGKSLPAGGLKVIAIWGVSATSPDYVYKYGEAKVAADGSYRLVVDSATLPMEARNRMDDFSFGVAVIAAVSADTNLADGRLRNEDARLMIGNAHDTGLIVRKGEIPERIKGKLSWPGNFPTDKLNCGRGVKIPGATFDAFKPSSCDGVDVKLGPFKWVNWT